MEKISIGSRPATNRYRRALSLMTGLMDLTASLNGHAQNKTAGSDPAAEATQAVSRIYQTEARRYNNIASFDLRQAYAFYDPDYTETEADGKTLNLSQLRHLTEQNLKNALRIHRSITLQQSRLTGSVLDVTYRDVWDCDVRSKANPGATFPIHVSGLYRDTWRRMGSEWRLIKTVSAEEKNVEGSPKFKQECTRQEVAMYKLLCTALPSGGYTANVEGGGTLACFNSVGTRLFTFPPRSACTDKFQHYVEKSLTLQMKTQVNLEASIGMRGGHRGFSQRLRRDAFFEGSNPNDEFNTIRFVYSDIRWD